MNAIRRLSFVALAAIALLALPAGASASRSDRDRDKMPDKWERAHHLNTHRNDARRDADRDGLKNLAEFRNGTDPQKVDSDDDGVDDRNDVVGTIKSFTDGKLTIAAADGREITAAVTPGTEIKCKKAPATTTAPAPAAPRSHGDDDGPNHDAGDDHGDDDGDNEDQGDDDSGCTTAALVAGAKVDEAELVLSATGATWKELEVVGV